MFKNDAGCNSLLPYIRCEAVSQPEALAYKPHLSIVASHLGAALSHGTIRISDVSACLSFPSPDALIGSNSVLKLKLIVKLLSSPIRRGCHPSNAPSMITPAPHSPEQLTQHKHTANLQLLHVPSQIRHFQRALHKCSLPWTSVSTMLLLLMLVVAATMLLLLLLLLAN